jgi:integrase
LAFLIAVWTGQRQGDLLALTWTAYDGTNIKLRQSKTGRYVVIPVGAPLKVALDAEPRRAVTILTTQAGLTWTADGFSASWRKAVSSAKVAGLTFHDLRGTAVLRLALAGCTVPEIATIAVVGTELLRQQNELSLRQIIFVHHRLPRLGG